MLLDWTVELQKQPTSAWKAGTNGMPLCLWHTAKGHRIVKPSTLGIAGSHWMLCQAATTERISAGACLR